MGIMGEEEVIKRLKEHLAAKKEKNGKLGKNDKYYCIHYVEDFLMCSRSDAVTLLEENFPDVMSLERRRKR